MDELERAHRAYLRKRFPSCKGWVTEAHSWNGNPPYAYSSERRGTVVYTDWRRVVRWTDDERADVGPRPHHEVSYEGHPVPRPKGTFKTPSWSYPRGVKKPKVRVPPVPPGTEVLFFDGRNRHHGHRCLVIDSWIKVAGHKQKNFKNYEFFCLECNCKFHRLSNLDRQTRLFPLPLTFEPIFNEPNTEIRRQLIERYGQERFLKESAAELVSQDDWGKLWRTPQPRDEPLVMVEMVNSSPEPDGSFKTYFERVPPDMRTPLEALAWRAQMTVDEYARIDIQT